MAVTVKKLTKEQLAKRDAERAKLRKHFRGLDDVVKPGYKPDYTERDKRAREYARKKEEEEANLRRLKAESKSLFED